MAHVKVKYLLRKSGLLYYQRAIPNDLKPHYSGKSLIRINLKTLDPVKATQLCAQYAAREDILWKQIRSGQDPNLTTVETRQAAEALLASWGAERGDALRWNVNNPQDRETCDKILQYFETQYGVGFICGFSPKRPNDVQSPIEHEALRLLNERPEERRILLSDALEHYLAEHKNGQDLRLARDTQRAIGIVVQIVGDLPLQYYTREHARAVRDALVPGHSTATVRRRLKSISAVFNLGRREFDLVWAANPFERMPIQKEGQDEEKRLPFTHDELATISKSCMKGNDDIRWIVAMQFGTGARLGEIVGLRREDVFLDAEIPHINIRPHENLGRSLKTPGSERKVPLIGLGLWAAKQAIQNARGGGWLFPRYAQDNDIRATHASNTVNKWISETLGIKKTSHSFRHSMKDLLRNVGCPDDIQRQLLGHGSKSVSDLYGQGYRLPVLASWLEKATQCF